MKSVKSYILCIKQEKLHKNIHQHNEFNKNIIQMDTTFINSKISKTSNPQRLLHNLTDKINLKRSDEYVALSNLSI